MDSRFRSLLFRLFKDHLFGSHTLALARWKWQTLIRRLGICSTNDLCQHYVCSANLPSAYTLTFLQELRCIQCVFQPRTQRTAGRVSQSSINASRTLTTPTSYLPICNTQATFAIPPPSPPPVPTPHSHSGPMRACPHPNFSLASRSTGTCRRAPGPGWAGALLPTRLLLWEIRGLTFDVLLKGGRLVLRAIWAVCGVSRSRLVNCWRWVHWRIKGMGRMSVRMGIQWVCFSSPLWC